jgi:hypothetical protein
MNWVSRGGKCSFEALVARYEIEDPAVHLLAKIVHGADVKQDLFEACSGCGPVTGNGLERPAKAAPHQG